MLRLTLTSLLAVACLLRSTAQPVPCGPTPSMTPFCFEACVICDIDGFTGINNNPTQGEAPPGFCTGTQHHIQWIAFIAGSTSLTLTVSVFNCQNGSGLEVGIYESLDCESFNLVSNCDGDIAPNTSGIFTTTQPLVIGQYYYFVMDGNMDDVCSYTINVTQGTTLVPPLPPAGAVEGLANPCVGKTATYAIPPITGANFYQWTLDGQPLGNADTLEIEWATPGVFELCVTAFNVCDTIEPVCMTIVATPLPPTAVVQAICQGECFDYNSQSWCDAGTYPVLLESAGGCDSLVHLTIQIIAPVVTNLVESICGGDCFAVADTLLCGAGQFSFLLAAASGCDSIVNLSLTVLPVVESDISAFICDYDSILVGDTYYHPPGQFDEVTTSWLGCDSVIHLTLGAVICEITGDFTAQQLFCHGDQTGKLTFSVVNGTPPFTYTWEKLGGAPSGSGSIPATNSLVTLDNLPPGVFLITILDNFGNDVVLVVEVQEPPALELFFETSDFNGFGVSCAFGQNGSATALPLGGTPPYSFTWSNGSQQAQLDSLPAGAYGVTITDLAGCTFAAQTTLDQPPPLTMSALFTDPNCDGYDSGSAAVTSVGGGVPPYEFAISGGGFDTATVFASLPGGSYDLAAQDASGCTADTTGLLVPVAIPQLDAGEDLTIKLGESERLQVFSSVPPLALEWSPATGLSCTDCLEPEASPYETTTYTLTVTSESGCSATDSVTVFVLKVRDVFIPNAFSPNADGLNDFLTVFAGRAVSRVLSFKVFSRWGELVFEGTDFAPNDLSQGWDGFFRGKKVQPGVFAWLAEIEFLDGETVRAEGDATVVR